jgi:hypothetical protein
MATVKKSSDSKAPKNLPPQSTQAVKGGLNFTKIKFDYRPQSAD